MSSAIVRSDFRSALQAQFPAIDYVETLGVNVDNEALPDMWMALDFSSFGQDRLSIGTPCYWEETGVCRVLISVEAGVGDAAAVAQADSVINYFRNWQVPAHMLRVASVSPPSIAQQESDGKWLMVTVDLMYSYGFFA